MTQEQFIKKYNLKEVTEPIRNSDSKYIDKIVGYQAVMLSIGYELIITIRICDKASDSYRLMLKTNISPLNTKEIFAMHTTELSLMEKITYDIINNYIKI